MNFKPLDDRLLISIAVIEEKTCGGIYIPDEAKEKPQMATVIATGEGAILNDGKRMKMDIQVGDVVYFAKYSGTEIKIEGIEYKILSRQEVLGVSTKEIEKELNPLLIRTDEEVNTLKGMTKLNFGHDYTANPAQFSDK